LIYKLIDDKATSNKSEKVKEKAEVSS
jgi:hypothetical protein